MPRFMGGPRAFDNCSHRGWQLRPGKDVEDFSGLRVWHCDKMQAAEMINGCASNQMHEAVWVLPLG